MLFGSRKAPSNWQTQQIQGIGVISVERGSGFERSWWFHVEGAGLNREQWWRLWGGGKKAEGNIQVPKVSAGDIVAATGSWKRDWESDSRAYQDPRRLRKAGKGIHLCPRRTCRSLETVVCPVAWLQRDSSQSPFEPLCSRFLIFWFTFSTSNPKLSWRNLCFQVVLSTHPPPLHIFNPLRSHFCWVSEPTNQVSNEQQPVQLWWRMRQVEMGQSVRGVHATMETTQGYVGLETETPRHPWGWCLGAVHHLERGPVLDTWNDFLLVPTTSQVASWQSLSCSSGLNSNASSFGGDPGLGENFHS